MSLRPTIHDGTAARHEVLLRELDANQIQLLSIADDLSRVNETSLPFISCDLRVLVGHPEVAQSEELVAKLNAIENRVSDLDCRLGEIVAMIRQHEAVALRPSSASGLHSIN
jgi:hypothetical protein